VRATKHFISRPFHVNNVVQLVLTVLGVFATDPIIPVRSTLPLYRLLARLCASRLEHRHGRVLQADLPLREPLQRPAQGRDLLGVILRRLFQFAPDLSR
jgi:hypothetical protein